MSADSEQLAARVVELETRLAFQDDTLHQLNDALLVQQRTVEQLRRELAALTDRLRGFDPSPVGRREDEPPPPHY